MFRTAASGFTPASCGGEPTAQNRSFGGRLGIALLPCRHSAAHAKCQTPPLFLPFASIRMTSNKQHAARALELARVVFMIGAGATVSLEHHKYERIPGTNRSVRFDRGDPGKCTEDHAHIFAQRGGQGTELFSVNCNGTGHDGSRGEVVPKKVADFLQQRGYRIPANLTLESIDFEVVEPGGWGIVVVLDTEPPLDSNRPAWLDW